MLAFAFTSSAWAVQVGDEVPNCALTSMDGRQKYDFQQFRGKVLYVDFWSSWCGPCAQSFAFLNQIHHGLKDRGLEVMAINLDEFQEEAQAFLVQHPAQFNVVADTTQQCAKAFEVQAMPSSYLIDRSGRIRQVHLGFRPEEAKELKLLAEKLLTEQPALK